MITTINPPISPDTIKRMKEMGWVLDANIRLDEPVTLAIAMHTISLVAYQGEYMVAYIEGIRESLIPPEWVSEEAHIIMKLARAGAVMPWFFRTTRHALEESTIELATLDCGLEFRMILPECSPLPMWITNKPVSDDTAPTDYIASASEGTIAILVCDEQCRIRAKCNIYTAISEPWKCKFYPARIMETLKEIIDISPIQAYAAIMTMRRS